MKNIKFRVLVDCEDHGKRFIYPTALRIFDTVAYVLDPKTQHEYQIEPDQLNQFTGLKDKNGKEIYESDLVKGDYTHKVIFEDSCFWIWREKNGAGENRQPLFTLIPISNIEVIGNIYENSELLPVLKGLEE